MAKKTIGIAAILLVMGFGLVFGQIGGTGNGKIDVAMDMKLNLGEVTSREISNPDVRPVLQSTKDFVWSKFGPEVTAWFTGDSYMKFGYEASNFGGYFRLNPLNIAAPQVKVWVNIGPMFKISAGNDIESLYADPLGADPGLRVYNKDGLKNDWGGYVNPDNITHSEGLLLEGFFGPVTVAFTGFLSGDNRPEFRTDSQNSENIMISDTRQFRLGGRAGSEIGPWGKVNASYSVAYSRKGSQYLAVNNELFPVTDATAEVSVHYLGVYASLTPLKIIGVDNLGVTLGYGGVITKYLDEIRDGNSMVEIVQPLVVQNAFMFNARYTDIVPGLTLRTDHNYSAWIDKNLLTMGPIPGWSDRTIFSKGTWPNAADVAHSVLWNGAGASYQLTRLLGVGLYVRNLYRKDFSFGNSGEEYSLERNQFVVEPSVNFSLGAMSRLSVSIEVVHYTETTSRDLNKAGANQFRPGMDAVETKDAELKIRIPVGVNIQF